MRFLSFHYCECEDPFLWDVTPCRLTGTCNSPTTPVKILPDITALCPQTLNKTGNDGILMEMVRGRVCVGFGVSYG